MRLESDRRARERLTMAGVHNDQFHRTDRHCPRLGIPGIREAGPLPEGGLQVKVAVSGPSFSVEDCRDLLHPLKGERGFTGNLGPALATAIAHWHGGELTAQPGDSQGLSFTLKLPASPQDHEDH